MKIYIHNQLPSRRKTKYFIVTDIFIHFSNYVEKNSWYKLPFNMT